jgi:hypothetical protein
LVAALVGVLFSWWCRVGDGKVPVYERKASAWVLAVLACSRGEKGVVLTCCADWRGVQLEVA